VALLKVSASIVLWYCCNVSSIPHQHSDAKNKKKEKKHLRRMMMMAITKQKTAAAAKSTRTTTIASVICAIPLFGGWLGSNTLLSQETVVPPTPTTPPPAHPKFFLALFLQYINKDNETNIYAPNMNDNDQTRLRIIDESTLRPGYVTAAKNLSGSAGVTFKSSKDIVDNAKRVKDLGFDFVEFNLEEGLSPSSDSVNVVSAMKMAADAAHAQGLKFRAIPSNPFTIQYGPQIAPFSDYYHIQAQSLQERGVKAYSDYVHAMVPELKKANPNLLISVQVSIQQGNASGLTLLETMKQCVDSVMDVVDGASVWFGRDDLNTLKLFAEWYNNKYT
jgi:hypothetical protein